MSNRRLNKKVALIGSVIFVVLALVAILAILHLSRDPGEYIKDAEAALTAARQATDEQIKQQNYDRAQSSFRSAYVSAKTNPLREEILFKMVDMYLEIKEWPFALGCWDEIIRIDPNNVKARYGRLKYLYIMADSSVRLMSVGNAGRIWQEVHKQASEFLKVAENADLLMENTAGWDVFETEQKETVQQSLGPYLYLVSGRAVLEMASLGAVTNRDESLAQAVDDLKKVQELEPNNIDAYWYLARAAVTKGELFASRGNLEERDNAIKEATALLEQAVQIAGTEPKAHINILALKLMLAKSSGPELVTERIRALEPEYLSLVRNFGSSAEAFAAISQFYSVYSAYSGPRLVPENLDKAIEAIEQAFRLDGNNVAYAVNAANLHYRRFAIYRQKQQVEKAIETAKNALTLPDAQDAPGPRHQAKINNRFILYAFLANCYIEQILEPCEPQSQAQTDLLLTGAEQAVHEIEQISGSGEEPLVIKWRGMLELAKGNREDAIRKLYEAYEKLKALKPPEPPWPSEPQFAQLSYTLAKIFKDTYEVGAVREFLISALNSGIGQTKPEAHLDYIDVILEFNQWSDAIQTINAFEEYFGPNERSRELRIKTYIGAKQFDDAEKELANRPEDDPNTIKLRLVLAQARIRQIQLTMAQKEIRESPGLILEQTGPEEKEPVELTADIQLMTEELKSYLQLEAELLGKLLLIEPNSVDQAFVIGVCRNYISQGQASRAESLVSTFLQYFPDNAAVLVYKQILSEPDPAKISQQRRKEIEEQVLSSVADPIRRATQLGIFYRGYNELEKATRQLNMAIEIGTSQQRVSEGPAFEQIKFAASHLLDIALATKDWELAEKITETTRRENLDNCQGLIFATRLSMAKGEFEDALAKIDECLKQRPVFSYAYMLRSDINASLGNEHASMEDIRKAASLNPLDGIVAKASANVLYRRNQKLGDIVSSAQIVEVRTALERAIALNPGDLALLGLYAEYIAPTEPLRAVAIRQDLQRAAPNMDNALLLGQLATDVAVKETNPQLKEALFGIAVSAFEQAKEINPRDKLMLYHYAQYFRARGQNEKAKALLQESQDEKLLWDHYFQRGQYEDARRVLEQLYKEGTKDSVVLKGLLLVAEKTIDREAVKKYSEELVALDEAEENNLIQIEAFLRVGLIKEAEYKLQSFKEKYPNEKRILLLQAWLLMRQGQLEKALELTNKNLQTNQNNAAAWRLRGEINFFLADYGKAISDFRESKLLSDEPVTRISLAKAYMGAGRYEDAITELEVTINAPGAPPEARLLLERIYSQLDRKEALKRFYKDTLEEFPDSVRWLNQAGAFAVKEGEFDKAEQLYKKACLLRHQAHLAEDERNEVQDVLYVTAFDGYLKALLLGAGEPNTANWDPRKLDKVFEECSKYVDSSIAPIAYLRMAQAKLKLGDRTTAVEYCRKSVDKAGENETFASEVLLRMFLMLGPDEVLKYCRQKLETNPNSLAANFAMFNLAKLNNEYEKAIDYIGKCIELTEPDSPRRANYTMNKADTLILAYKKSSDNNYLRTAITVYKSLLVKMPNNTSILNNLAYLLAENNERLPEALVYAKRALDTQPNNPGFLDTYAYVLHKKGENSQAAEFVAAALQQYQQNDILVPAEVYEHKGMIKEELGAKDEALAAYKQALEIGADRLSQEAEQRINKAIERLSP
ncbi:MAG TPA: tetratricopeptide repeat protein [Sedimentisphaerales bacterium]|nr:tetratricopeptide repeat protein [Sedimentisphaerales bacterium]